MIEISSVSAMSTLSETHRVARLAQLITGLSCFSLGNVQWKNLNMVSLWPNARLSVDILTVVYARTNSQRLSDVVEASYGMLYGTISQF
jgi:hypothetical protein